MTASSFSSEQIFQNARELLVLRASEALKPLVEFMESHECDDDDILSAIFEAIAYEKDAELELGAYAYDAHQDLAIFGENFVAERFAEMLYKFGLDLYRELQLHKLYCNGFLPYQYMKHHGNDLVVSRLDVPSILHRENVVHGDRPIIAWKPKVTKVVNAAGQVFYYLGEFKEKKTETEADQRLDALIRKFGEVPHVGTPEEVLGSMAQAFRDYHATTEAPTAAPLSEPDAVEKFQQEMEAIFGSLRKPPEPAETDPKYASAGDPKYVAAVERQSDLLERAQRLRQRADNIQRSAGEEFEATMQELNQEVKKNNSPGQDWSAAERADFRRIQDIMAQRNQPDERSVMTVDALNAWYADLLKLKEQEMKTGGSWMPPQKRWLMELVYRSKVHGDLNAAAELEEHVNKTVRIVDDSNDPPYNEPHEEWLRRDDQRKQALQDDANESQA